jgi:hypothetical protein
MHWQWMIVEPVLSLVGLRRYISIFGYDSRFLVFLCSDNSVAFVGKGNLNLEPSCLRRGVPLGVWLCGRYFGHLCMLTSLSWCPADTWDDGKSIHACSLDTYALII